MRLSRAQDCQSAGALKPGTFGVRSQAKSARRPQPFVVYDHESGNAVVVTPPLQGAPRRARLVAFSRSIESIISAGSLSCPQKKRITNWPPDTKRSRDQLSLMAVEASGIISSSPARSLLRPFRVGPFQDLNWAAGEGIEGGSSRTALMCISGRAAIS